MTSSIEHAIKELHDEQKRSDSRRSSLLSSQGLTIISRQVSNASSIVEVNSTARSGGYSPAGYMMSPPGSFTTGRVRSASKGSRFGRPEPDLEGRPLDSFSNHSAMSPGSPTFSIDFDRTPSIAEGDEEDSTTMTRDLNDYFSSAEVKSPLESPKVDDGLLADDEKERPVTPASIATIEREKMFEDFDGTHNDDLPPPPPPHLRSISETHTQISDNSQLRVSSNGSGGRVPMVRPQSYADPSTGQQMVYYPAPVPMMLNLPQKLSKNPSSMARNKRRSQVLSSIPSAARNSAIWLPDVLEQEDEAMNEETQQHEYIPQHQRASMGGRRLPQDLTHLPPQLRANTYFDLPSTNQVIQLKEQSAVATLDSILDASAHAPVSAFTDHAFAGALGNEVYGRPHMRNSRSTSGLNETTKKRTSSFNILRGLRASSTTDLLDSDKEKRSATMSGWGGNAGPGSTADMSDDGKDTTHLQQSENGSRAIDGEHEEEEGSDDGQLDEIYSGPPTTLLAELQLRKQRQKQRTLGLATAYPNGMHSTLLEMDAVAEHEKKSRKQKRTFLAWEDPSAIQDELSEDDEDVPLAMLYAQKNGRIQEAMRPLGLMERREQEDNEPLSRRRDRLQGRPPVQRASTMMNLSGPFVPSSEAAPAGLPEARPVSGDFATEIMSQFGDNLLSTSQDKGKGKAPPSPDPGAEEDETLGQRRKRLQAEREARAKEVGDSTQQRPALQHMKRRSMADILQAHPSAGADRAISYQKPSSGLLGLHERKSSQRANSIMDFTAANATANPNVAQKKDSTAFKAGQFNDGQGGIIPPSQISPLPQPNYGLYAMPNMHTRSATMFAQPTLPASNGLWNSHGGGMGNNFQGNQMLFSSFNNAGYAGGHGANGLGGGGFGQNNLGLQMQQMQHSMMGMQSNMLAMGVQPLNQGQIDMVERWRQSVMH